MGLFSQKTFADYLKQNKILEDNVIVNLEKESKASGVNIKDLIIEKNLLKAEDVIKYYADFLKIPIFSIKDREISDEILKEMPVDIVDRYKMIPIGIDPKKRILEIAMVNPDNLVAQEALKIFGLSKKLKPSIFLISKNDFEEILRRYRTLGREVEELLVKVQEELKEKEIDLIPLKGEVGRELVEEAPITKMVATILRHGIESNASDIHIEPMEDSLRVRYRIDGVLQKTLSLPLKIHPTIISRIKILSNLKIDETRKPQDGRFSIKFENRKIDFRVSTLPTAYGEKAALRILDPIVGIKTFEEIGIDGVNFDALSRNIEKPYGMILITGPTGSGKTTTLYAMLHYLNKEGVNIISLEDPVEYYIEGINQSQINPEIGYSFASGLRSILRQDPDIIMVGEIRDKETAELAIHAALTGHLVLSTLHTNDAIGIFPRLIDMGIEKFLLPSTVILGIAQRLVKRLCPNCKKKVKVSKTIEKIILEEYKLLPEEIKKENPLPAAMEFFEPVGCDKCRNKGTKGRIAIFEMVEMTPELESIILSDLSETNLLAEMRRQHKITLRQDGLLKAIKGEVSFREVIDITMATTSADI